MVIKFKDSTRSAKFRDTMQIAEGFKYIDLDTGKELVDCRVYVTNRSGVYGYQFRSIVWAAGVSGISPISTGCGYNKVSAVVHQALNDMGFPAECDGTGTHAFELRRLADILNPENHRIQLVHFHP